MNNRINIITGAQGFLGRYICEALSEETNITLGRSHSNDIQVDLSKEVPRLTKGNRVIHSAGKAHMVPKSDYEINEFYAVNLLGTQNLTKGLDSINQQIEQFVFISTVAVYGKSKGMYISEDAPLLGDTPYALSKIKAEQFLTGWCKERKIPLLILRPALIVGQQPPGNLGNIIKSIQSGRYISIKSNNARKSMVLASDIGVLLSDLSQENGIFNLTDGEDPSFSLIERAIATGLKIKPPVEFPFWFFRVFASLGDIIVNFGGNFPLTTNVVEKMTNSLTFNSSKAQNKLGWQPKSSLRFLEKGMFV